MKVLNQTQGENYHAYNADCIEVAKALPDNSIGYSVYSPPFVSLYTYSNSDRDMSNNSGDEEFFQQYQFLIEEKLRITKPGRLTSVHCCDLPSTMNSHGVYGVRDFSGDIIRAHQKAGWIYHSRVTIWKNPVMQMQRTKKLGLLHKTIKKDSAMSHQGGADYIITFRKPGENDTPIEGPFKWYAGAMSLRDYAVAMNHYKEIDQWTISDKYQDGMARQFSANELGSISVWQHYASPVWFDIAQSNTLEFRSARSDDDEKHISPLQLDVIERCLQLWSMPGDVVFSPFMGIGSEGYVALNMLDGPRKFIGTELKESYYKVAVKNLDEAELNEEQGDLFE